MKRKYLKKITVSARFNTQILTQAQYKGYDDEQKKELWRIYLKALVKSNQISSNQSNTWKYPSEIL